MASGKWKGRLWECDRLASCLAPLAGRLQPPAAMADIEKEAVYEVISSTTAEERRRHLSLTLQSIFHRQPGHCAMVVCGECRVRRRMKATRRLSPCRAGRSN